MEILFIENYRNSRGELIYEEGKCLLIQKLSEVLGVENLNLKLDHYNKPLSKEELIKMRGLNKTFVHGIGNQSYGTGTNFHRLKDYFGELNLPIDDDKLYQDARVKNSNIEKATKLGQETFSEVEFLYPDKIYTFLKNLFEESNRRFEKQLNTKIPSSYLEF